MEAILFNFIHPAMAVIGILASIGIAAYVVASVLFAFTHRKNFLS